MSEEEYSSIKFPRCTKYHPDCYAYLDGKCRVLNGMTKGFGCSFYKTEEQYKKERKRYDF